MGRYWAMHVLGSQNWGCQLRASLYLWSMWYIHVCSWLEHCSTSIHPPRKQEFPNHLISRRELKAVQAIRDSVGYSWPNKQSQPSVDLQLFCCMLRRWPDLNCMFFFFFFWQPCVFETQWGVFKLIRTCSLGAYIIETLPFIQTVLSMTIHAFIGIIIIVMRDFILLSIHKKPAPCCFNILIWQRLQDEFFPFVKRPKKKSFV